MSGIIPSNVPMLAVQLMDNSHVRELQDIRRAAH